MSKEFTKKAIEMLLGGATLISDPCPYCKGVRIIKEGSAFCVNCGREDNKEKIFQSTDEPQDKIKESSAYDKLDQKLKELTDELQQEKDHAKQQQILKLINDIIAVKEKLKTI
ncbi:MAG: Sjogren's syndrome/scleroderma autoantigen 1 family protein [Nitrosotalea sp.]